MQNGDLQTVAFRLTRPEIQLIHAGLKPAVSAWAYGKKVGRFPFTDFLRVYVHIRPREGEFSQRFMDYVLAAWATWVAWVEDKNAKSHRVRLDPIVIAILHFFVRIADRQVRHGHATSPVANLNQTVARLGRKLENRRRQALRKTKACGKGPAYAKLAGEWHLFQTWMRGNLLYCRCHRPSPFPTWHSQQVYIAACERVARKAIEDDALGMPEPKELRRLVRLLMRDCRRGRGVGLRTLLKGDADSLFIWRRFFRRHLTPLSEINEGNVYEETKDYGQFKPSK
jgi:hypothetical protein